MLLIYVSGSISEMAFSAMRAKGSITEQLVSNLNLSLNFPQPDDTSLFIDVVRVCGRFEECDFCDLDILPPTTDLCAFVNVESFVEGVFESLDGFIGLHGRVGIVGEDVVPSCVD